MKRIERFYDGVEAGLGVALPVEQERVIHAFPREVV